MAQFRLLGGQYFFGGEESSLSSNASLMLSPVIQFNDKWSLLPIYTGAYQGTKQVTDLVGGGTLFQELQDHRISFKGLYTPGPGWRIKPNLSYKVELLKETKDETWNHGLFDYQKPNVGAEVEYVYQDPFSIRAGYDFYAILFPNYKSLESQVSQLSRELAGDKVLNSYNHALSLGGSLSLPRSSVLELEIDTTLRQYPDQHIVLASGELSQPTRRDQIQSVSAGIKTPVPLSKRWRLLTQVGLGLAWNQSDQNGYDAQRTRFIPHYYDYLDYRISPGFQFFYGPQDRPLILGLSGWVSTRDYSKRPVQNSEGTYGSEKIHTWSSAATASMSYPVAPHFALQLATQLGWNSSNMKYEKLYRYNFHTATYLIGFSYEY